MKERIKPLRFVLWAILGTGLIWATWSFAQDGTEPASEGEQTEVLETFVPTEEVAADQAVAFPVDI